MIQNGIPITALIIESSVVLLILSLDIATMRKYRERRKQTTFLLSMSFIGYSFAVFSSVFGKYLDYFSDIPQEEFSNSSFTINLAYCFVAAANIFLYQFIEIIFLTNKEWRIYGFAMLNSILIGLILGNNSFDNDAYSNQFILLVILVISSSFVYILLFIRSIHEIRSTTETKVKVGMMFIGLFALFLQLMFVLFITDLLIIQSSGSGYSIPYFIAWIAGGIACICGYLGYINPQWLRNLFGSVTS